MNSLPIRRSRTAFVTRCFLNIPTSKKPRPLGFGGAFAASAIIVGQLIQKQEGCAFDDSTDDELWVLPTRADAMLYFPSSHRHATQCLWPYIPRGSVLSVSISPMCRSMPSRHNSNCIIALRAFNPPSSTTRKEAKCRLKYTYTLQNNTK